jgi:hypothetical protein
MRRRLGRGRSKDPRIELRTAGRALLIYRQEKFDQQAQDFADGLAEDTENTLVVLDLPADSPPDCWNSVADLLERRGGDGSLRLVFGWRSGGTEAAVAQLLADRLAREVIAPDGPVVPAAGGVLFVPDSHGTGWLRFGPGRAARWDSQRFPKPGWEFTVPREPRPCGRAGVAEPLPGGVWVRDTYGGPRIEEHRRRLVNHLPCRHDSLTVVLGRPGAPALPFDDVARFCDMILPGMRASTRFVPYGPADVPGGGSLGQALADLLDEPVVCCTGLPTSGRTAADPCDLYAMGEDGSFGWRPFAREVRYEPARDPSGAEPPVTVLDHRPPAEGLAQIAAGVYALASDAVVEVVQSGLWVRPPAEPAGASTVRAAPARPGHVVIRYDSGSEQTADRMRWLAEEVLAGLDPATREVGQVMAGHLQAAMTGHSRADRHSKKPGNGTSGVSATVAAVPPAPPAPGRTRQAPRDQ